MRRSSVGANDVRVSSGLQKASPFPEVEIAAAPSLKEEVSASVRSEVGNDDAIVSIGDTVVVRFADNGTLRRFKISLDKHDPSGGIVNASQPLASALLGAAVDDEVEFTIENKSRIALVERILKAAA